MSTDINPSPKPHFGSKKLASPGDIEEEDDPYTNKAYIKNGSSSGDSVDENLENAEDHELRSVEEEGQGPS